MATVYLPLDVLAAVPGTTAIPTLVMTAGTNAPVPGWSFLLASTQAIYWPNIILPYYGSGTISLVCGWYSASGATTGNVKWIGSMAAVTPADAQSLETKAFATATNVTTTVTGTAKALTSSTVALSNLDGAAALDRISIKLIGDAASTMTGSAILVTTYLSYSDV